jgi:hypothetical protein
VKKFLPIIILGALGFALAAQTAYTLTINGKPSSLSAIVLKGETYVPLKALTAAGVGSSIKAGRLSLTLPGANTPPDQTAAGGTNQRASLEGCIGETLFNGIWRLTARKVEAIGPDVGLGPGWGVTVELRNGTTTKTNLHDTGLTSIELVQPDGNTFEFEEHDAEEKFLYKELTQAGGVTYQLRFHVADTKTPAASVPRPSKLTVQIDPTRVTAGYLIAAKVAYSTPTPSFRVRLDCQK